MALAKDSSSNKGALLFIYDERRMRASRTVGSFPETPGKSSKILRISSISSEVSSTIVSSFRDIDGCNSIP